MDKHRLDPFSIALGATTVFFAIVLLGLWFPESAAYIGVTVFGGAIIFVVIYIFATIVFDLS